MKVDRDVAEGGCWSSARVEVAFGNAVLTEATAAAKRYWRRHKPLLWSERQPGERNQYQSAWIFGLSGVYAESVESNWTDMLSDDEVGIATRYALIQLNGRPDFLDDLIKARPAIVSDLLLRELKAQFEAWADSGEDSSRYVRYR